MTTDAADDLVHRVARLERSARRWRRVAMGVVTLTALAGVLAFRGATAPRSIDADRIILHDPTGWDRVVELSMGAGGELRVDFKPDTGRMHPPLTSSTALVLVDRWGKEVARLGTPVTRRLAQ
jgi:hypothetical protein